MSVGSPLALLWVLMTTLSSTRHPESNLDNLSQVLLLSLRVPTCAIETREDDEQHPILLAIMFPNQQVGG